MPDIPQHTFAIFNCDLRHVMGRLGVENKLKQIELFTTDHGLGDSTHGTHTGQKAIHKLKQNWNYVSIGKSAINEYCKIMGHKRLLGVE